MFYASVTTQWRVAPTLIFTTGQKVMLWARPVNTDKNWK